VDERTLGILAALTSAASWALGSVLFKKLGDQLTPITLTFAKGVVGTVFLALALGPSGFHAIELPELMMLALSGLLGIAIGDTLFFKALGNLGAHAIVVLLTLGQVFTLLLAVIWLGERPSAAEWLGIGFVIAGVTLVLWVRLSENGTSRLVGVAWGLAAVVCMAVSTIIAKEALAITDSVQAAFVRMLAGTIGIFLFAAPTRQLIGRLAPLKQPGFAGFFLLSVAVVTFGGFWLSLFAIKKVDVTIANTLGSTEPLFVLPLAAFLLKESIKPAVVAGSTLAVAGIILLLHPW
jgi:drug/metabolite transporter (DMT)-like permease